MKKRINAKFMVISALAVILTGVCSSILFYNILETQIFDDLWADAQMVQMMNPDLNFENHLPSFEEKGIRLTIIETDGTVRYDNWGNEDSMENHGNREEIVEAMEKGEGKAVRFSATSSKHTFYYAMQTKDGTILRIAKASSSIYTLLVQMIITIACVCVIVFAFCIIWSHSLTKKIMLPIEKMADNIMFLEEDVIYEEMRPFAEMIRQQHVDILQHAKIRQEFSANVSHELKTPLTAISGYAELIANGMTKKKDTIHFANEIHKGAERLQYLINDIIKLSELDDGDASFEFEEVDLYEITKGCAETLRLTAENNGVYIYVEGSSTKVNGNRTLMEELVYNLCSNAIRYNREGGSVILFTHMQNGQPILEVKDTGIGISKEQQERVFERFYRVDKSRSKNTGGTGLGLAIVKHIVAQHNAEISLVSEEGKGTEIKVIF